MSIAARLYRALIDAGVPVISVSIGNKDNKATWRVSPESLQAAAQPFIDAFNPDDPAHVVADLARDAVNDFDNARIFAALLWEVINAVNPPATRAKFLAARANVIEAYKTAPWKL